MIRALLTIDDIASENTPAIVDYLKKNNIPALMFGKSSNMSTIHRKSPAFLQGLGM